MPIHYQCLDFHYWQFKCLTVRQRTLCSLFGLINRLPLCFLNHEPTIQFWCRSVRNETQSLHLGVTKTHQTFSSSSSSSGWLVYKHPPPSGENTPVACPPLLVETSQTTTATAAATTTTKKSFWWNDAFPLRRWMKMMQRHGNQLKNHHPKRCSPFITELLIACYLWRRFLEFPAQLDQPSARRVALVLSAGDVGSLTVQLPLIGPP